MSKIKKLKTYEISYSLLGSGSISIEASNLTAAKEIFHEMNIDDLIKETSFDDSCEIDSIN